MSVRRPVLPLRGSCRRATEGVEGQGLAAWPVSTPRPKKDLARTLRKDLSLPEVLLWKALKGRRFQGLRFRRQHPIGPYIVDFYCPALRVALEVDGEGHSLRFATDAVRDAWLNQQGVRVFRLSAVLILASVDDALSTLGGWLETQGEGASTPSGPPGHLPLRGRT